MSLTQPLNELVITAKYLQGGLGHCSSADLGGEGSVTCWKLACGILAFSIGVGAIGVGICVLVGGFLGQIKPQWDGWSLSTSFCLVGDHIQSLVHIFWAPAVVSMPIVSQFQEHMNLECGAFLDF